MDADRLEFVEKQRALFEDYFSTEDLTRDGYEYENADINDTWFGWLAHADYLAGK